MKNREINSQQNKWLRKCNYYEKELDKIYSRLKKSGEDDVRNSPQYAYYLECHSLMICYYKLSLIEDDL